VTLIIVLIIVFQILALFSILIPELYRFYLKELFNIKSAS